MALLWLGLVSHTDSHWLLLKAVAGTCSGSRVRTQTPLPGWVQQGSQRPDDGWVLGLRMLIGIPVSDKAEPGFQGSLWLRSWPFNVSSPWETEVMAYTIGFLLWGTLGLSSGLLAVILAQP